MDELDNQIIEVLSKQETPIKISDLVKELESTYRINFVRAKVRRHADSLCKYNVLTRIPVKMHTRRTSIYGYRVVKE